ncbi:UvrD-helicase domain-containing protein [Leyella stercorea]|uniref:UvrD-helicase domain-containing protein n=1 Tax=Leyella stercorea TaxID=363265 RepID=UPI00242B22F5|nr:UvrD-helicase domain-containing protein [Leyella stercorea]
MDKEVEKIIEHIENGENFLLSGGAGSGKTYSLVQVIREVITRHPSSKIACMTYTNASVHEIDRRVDHPNLNVSTIHDFLWDNIKNFQRELKASLIEMLNTEDSGISLNGYEGEVPSNFFDKDREPNFAIQYKEYLKLQDGIISHDEVLKLSEKMFFKYPKIVSFVKSRYPFVFIDEYQDTNPLIVKILLEYFPKVTKKCIVGFFGDSMQAIYDDGVGNIDSYLITDENPDGCVYEVQKKQNRRCPQSVIALANSLRLDSLHQEPSDDLKAPNMTGEGHVKEGSISFYYSDEDNTDVLKEKLTNEFGWDFSDTENTKELRLTHNLIANEAGFETLMRIHDSDKIIEYGKRIRDYAKMRGVLDDIKPQILDESIKILSSRFPDDKKKWSPTKSQQDFINTNSALYAEALTMPFESIACYIDKDQLLDDKSEEDASNGTGSKLSPLNQHLHKIEHCIQLYLNEDYNEFMRSTSIKQIVRARQKKELREGIDRIVSSYNDMTISEVIDLADRLRICVIDDKVKSYIENNPYLWKRIKEVSYQEARNVYDYRMGNKPFSTQHKTKGLEYDNVLVILKSNWTKYNFDSLFYDAHKNASIVERTKKLFYVCCTRAKENLVVYYPLASVPVVEGAKILFGKGNVHEL